MKYELYTQVALEIDIPEHNFKKGDVATICEYFEPGKNPEPGLALEFFNTIGDTVDVLFVPESYVEPLAADEIWHPWHLAEAA